jgi:NitT/TauT family transport system substrate-binding protein
MRHRLIGLICLGLLSSIGICADKTIIRIGVMASGTLSWELAAMHNEGLLDNTDFQLEPVTLANQQAGKVALQAGSVDIIISDWIWTSSMRAEGRDYSFYPYSSSAGGLIVAANSSINTLADLQGQKLGIAGGELDKNWYLLQALAFKQGINLNQSVEKSFAAPPLLNQQLASQRIDALLTYWQFAARLSAQGYRQILSGEDIIQQLGFNESVPSLGYVFKQSWAAQHTSALQQFLTATQAAKLKLCDADQAWQKVLKLTETDDAHTQQQLRNHYCQGIVKQWGTAQQKAAEGIYLILHQLDDSKLTGKSSQLQPGTFWSFN